MVAVGVHGVDKAPVGTRSRLRVYFPKIIVARQTVLAMDLLVVAMDLLLGGYGLACGGYGLATSWLWTCLWWLWTCYLVWLWTCYLVWPVQTCPLSVRWKTVRWERRSYHTCTRRYKRSDPWATRDPTRPMDYKEVPKPSRDIGR
jgi:hypothetical protein